MSESLSAANRTELARLAEAIGRAAAELSLAEEPSAFATVLDGEAGKEKRS